MREGRRIVSGGGKGKQKKGREWKIKKIAKMTIFHPQGGIFRASWPPEGSKTSIFIIFFKLRI